MACEVKQFVKRGYKHVHLLTVAPNDKDWPSNNLLDLIRWFHEQVDEIPYNERINARCEISATDENGTSWPEIRIWYMRSETDDEMEKRALDDREQQSRVEQRELDLLAKLQEKYSRKR
jgi:hypothetical protein